MVTIPHTIATIIVIVGNVATDLNTSIAAPPKIEKFGTWKMWTT